MQDICDYEGSDYKERFWTRDRRYEDLVERRTLQRLLPPRGRAIADLGAGFGRLLDLYGGYERVFLVDYSRTLLQKARQQHTGDAGVTYVAADIRRLPLATHRFDAVVTVRVLHHLHDIAPALAEVARVLAGDGTYVLEFASKRHLKAIARYLAGRQAWNPFGQEPIEFAEMNFDFHPSYVRRHLQQVGLRVEKTCALSLFRWQPLKQRLEAERLARLDAVLQPIASLYPLSPSVMLRARAPRALGEPPDYLLACPLCHGPLREQANRVLCDSCRRCWPKANGIYDFKSDGQLL